MGAIIRKELGIFRYTPACGQMGNISVIQVEAEALRSGLRLMMDLGVKDIEVEVDLLRLVNLLKGLVAPMSHLGLLYDDIRDMFLLATVASLPFKHRKQNGVVYRFVQVGISLLRECRWLNKALDIIRNVLLVDDSQSMKLSIYYFFLKKKRIPENNNENVFILTE